MASKARELANLGNAYSDGALSNRNLIINGAMQVAQRGTSVTSYTGDGYSTVDRFKTRTGTLGVWTISQSSDVPTGEGFGKSLSFECTTADASPASGDYLFLQYLMEGQDLQRLKYGTSSAETVTLTFWVKSSKTGTAQVNLRDSDNTKLLGGTYTISSANTWEKKTVTYIGNTADALDADANNSLGLEWWLDSGSTYTGGTSPTVWEVSDQTDRNANNLGLGDTVGNTFLITGVQLEVGDTATPFEHRSYGQELALCQRYYLTFGGTAYQGYCVGEANDSVVAVMVKNFPNDMRAAPTFTYSGAFRVREAGSTHDVDNGLTLSVSSFQSCVFLAVFTTSVLVAGNACRFYNNNDANARLNFDAEL